MAIKYNDPQFAALETRLESEYSLPTGIMAAIRTRGEKSNNNQVSPKGAAGVYQFMPDTWNKFADAGTKPTDPQAAATAAARYLAYANKLYKGDVGAMAAEYNGGPRAARKYIATGDPGNKETRDYVGRVMAGMQGVRAPVNLQSNNIKIASAEPTGGLFGGSQYTGGITPTPLQDMNADMQLDTNLDGGLDTSLDTSLETNMAMFEDDLLNRKVDRIVDEVMNG